jgi:flagellum-specific ATP synthase
MALLSTDDFDVDLEALDHRIRHAPLMLRAGKVNKVVGMVVEATVPDVSVGSLCEISADGGPGISAEVVGFRGDTALLMPLGDIGGVRMGAHVRARKAHATVCVNDEMLGRVIDGLGRPLDGRPLPTTGREMPLYASPPNPLTRKTIRQPMWLGIRAIDTLLTCGRGQRVGIMAGSGVGKSVLLGMMARNAISDVNVIGLIGERGRELREFIEKDLGPAGLARSVVVCATSDTAPLVRIRGAWLATSIAEYFRGQGKNVLLMMDSVTRFAMAQREIGLAVGEPPATRGYTPSVFSLLPRLLERAGTCEGNGSITGLYTVLVEQDDMNDPIGDAVRSIIDGHIVLSRDIAARNHFPAIDVMVSASRVMSDVAKPEHKVASGQVKELIAAFRKAEDLINIGAYQKGANPTIDRAVAQIGNIDKLLRQGMLEKTGPEDAVKMLQAIAQAPAPSPVAPGGAAR